MPKVIELTSYGRLALELEEVRDSRDRYKQGCEAKEREVAVLQSAIDKAHSVFVGSQYVGGPTEREAWIIVSEILGALATEHQGEGKAS